MYCVFLTAKIDTFSSTAKNTLLFFLYKKSSAADALPPEGESEGV